MPSTTFIRLKESKKKKLLAAAYSEFATRGAYAGSITNLVKILGIAKGSIYQYFQDKDDLHNYLIAHAFENKKNLISAAATPAQAGSKLFSINLVTAKFDLAFPQYATLLYGHCIPADDNYRRQMAFNIELIADIDSTGFADMPLRASLFGSLQYGFFKHLVEMFDIEIEEHLHNGEPIVIGNKDLISEVTSFTSRMEKTISD